MPGSSVNRWGKLHAYLVLDTYKRLHSSLLYYCECKGFKGYGNISF
jgi:hypothetical protein